MTLLGPTSHTYFSQRLKLHYADWGNEDAPPLLLVHGGRDHCRSWDWTAEVLRKDWHVIAPDLRGHGDSAWSPEGNYNMQAYIYDLAQLIHQLKLAPVTIVSHSLGGNICLRYTGLYPENVRKIVAIEGLGPSPDRLAERRKTPWQEHFRKMIDDKRGLAGRQPKRYDTLEQAYARMKEENSFLTAEQARHLTINGIARNEDGTYSWKFDNYLRVWESVDITHEQVAELWSNISCPTLLLYGEKSWASNPAEDGRIKHFKHADVKMFPEAGHWLHHDQFDLFIETLRDFL
ncbi:MAG: alpha/beta hydrolase [Henriciella sp.]|jgi:pimeloyl-ACP methyl ester carboxylesterase|uniref:alpha/beta fold hydrolase n=1 Tax=Henriciella sp. TaxID=1968823 RepID=UPI000C0D33FF|nr:alpha/beta hydrolase [Henriciella sp.]MAN75213.1 alpha/beta hydrolase [Henriciella sp.]MBF34406.1 alpha/beta hydrolase [Hyphomonadaceae bacterium]PHR80200.1 MAG: alpha/beta hydrolase [Henriciella sp.]|tara:strand:+ start:3095 stop:3964 length:870 start_codon:yes stop_codon:yes gene_type:complete